MGKARGDKIVMWLVWSVQGGWEDDKSVEEAACSEAFEEAGVKGIINVRACCRYGSRAPWSPVFKFNKF
jgi:8-oxo-dGTP pyrophosphatase MutT (NUDIX family)